MDARESFFVSREKGESHRFRMTSSAVLDTSDNEFDFNLGLIISWKNNQPKSKQANKLTQYYLFD